MYCNGDWWWLYRNPIPFYMVDLLWSVSSVGGLSVLASSKLILWHRPWKGGWKRIFPLEQVILRVYVRLGDGILGDKRWKMTFVIHIVILEGGWEKWKMILPTIGWLNHVEAHTAGLMTWCSHFCTLPSNKNLPSKTCPAVLAQICAQGRSALTTVNGRDSRESGASFCFSSALEVSQVCSNKGASATNFRLGSDSQHFTTPKVSLILTSAAFLSNSLTKCHQAS